MRKSFERTEKGKIIEGENVGTRDKNEMKVPKKSTFREVCERSKRCRLSITCDLFSIFADFLTTVSNHFNHSFLTNFSSKNSWYY